MTARSVTHATFHIERTFDASPARVYAAFADPAQKKRWACHEDWRCLEMAFEVGGREVNRGGEPGGPVFTFDGLYQDIVPNERIVMAYTMDSDDTRVSASIITLQFRPEGAGTRLTFTDQGAYLDGHADPVEREHGSGLGLDTLTDMLRRERLGADQ